MTTETQGPRTGDFMLGAPGTIALEYGTLASGNNLTAGTVLGRVTSSGKLAPYDNTASDGTETAVGVLYDNVDATDADQAVTYVARLAEVQTDKLVWDVANDGAAQTAGLADLSALNIIAR